ncbi:MAG: EamA family transporter RarD [Albidovulum sp.]
MTEGAKGVIAMIAACTVWGLSGIYYKAIDHVPAPEVLAHRTLWSLAFFMVVLTVQGRLRLVPAMLISRDLPLVIASAVMISVNWFFYIWSIQTGHALEASLGYYIYPFVAVMLGSLVYREALRRVQWSAVALAALAVLVLTVGLGATPWVAFLLASTFGAYGLLKRRIEAGPVLSVAGEVVILAPFAFAGLWAVHSGHLSATGGAFGANLHDTAMLAFSGIITGGPLMLFSYATKRVRMATVGLVQYLNPTLQFIAAALIFGEPVTFWHLISFPLIWVALVLYSASALRQQRQKAVPVAG